MTEKPMSDNIINYAQDIIGEFISAFQKLQITPEFVNVVKTMCSCNGKIITTGMGKAGIAMRKFSSTLCSLGVSSCYLHPGEASHGDLGVISKQDVLFVASTSGKTREVIEIIGLARQIGIKQIIGITSHPDSPIRKMADMVIDMGIIVEAGHLRLAPTTSILIMIALTDCLALTIAKLNKFTKKQYSRYHHSGYLGQKAREEARLH